MTNIDTQIILIGIGVIVIVLLVKLLNEMRGISNKISDTEIWSSELQTPRPLLLNLENLRDDVETIGQNLCRIMKKYGIETWGASIANLEGAEEEE